MMKKTVLFLIIICCFVPLVFSESIREESLHRNEKWDTSYAFGMAVAQDLSQIDLEFDYGAFIRGFREVMENQSTLIPIDEAMDKVDNAIYAAVNASAELNLEKEKAFLAENAARPGVFTTPSGLQYEIIFEGNGGQPAPDDFIRVNYIGYLTDGTVFDNSYERGEPEEFPLSGVIPGWSEGLQLMREGGKSRLFIPSKLAYGSYGAGGIIPPNSVIIFEIEFLEIIEAPEGSF